MGPYADATLPLKSVEYINASPIDNLGPGSLPFVATMCPKNETFAHFWSMVWEQGSRVIINLTHERDRVGSGPSDKRERYWPPLDPKSEKQMAKWPVVPHTLTTESCDQVPSLLCHTIELEGPVSADGSARPTRTVLLYWYSRWVDFPSSSSIGSRPFYANAWAVLHIGLHVVQKLEELGPSHWAICHCSAGVGRTGTFLGLVHMLRVLPRITSEAALDDAVSTTIEAMRERRLWMVSAPRLPRRRSRRLQQLPARARLASVGLLAPPPPHAHICRPLPVTACPSLQVKTDIEYATLYAALLLRLRNPDDGDFALTWSLKEGSYLTSHVGGGNAADLKRVTPTRTSPADAAALAASLATNAGTSGAAASNESGAMGGSSTGSELMIKPPSSHQRPMREQRQALAAHMEEEDSMEEEEEPAGEKSGADQQGSTSEAAGGAADEVIDNEADVAMYAGVGTSGSSAP